LWIKMRSIDGQTIQLISPSSTDSFLSDIPRSITATTMGAINTEVPEVDSFHAWARLALLQNLIRQHKINKLVIYGPHNFEELREKLLPYGELVQLLTWEEQNNTLVWALRLESTMMLFLFISMTILVSLCITSGLLIFFNKVKEDLAAMWVIGASEKDLQRVSLLFINILSGGAVLLGLLLASLFLWYLDYGNWELMPDVFIDRKIPILIKPSGIMISFFIPFLMASLFSWLTIHHFRKEVNYLEQVRALG
jgi:lipoprotein-releasing system permease protein